MEADYRIAQELASPESSNSYRDFFGKFNGAQFLTFNYDSLPEIFLSQDGRWQPEDGYGVPVSVELAFGANPLQIAKSDSAVIHLHGSACVYTIESEIVGSPVGGGIAQLVRRVEPLYAFDPDSISHCFPRYRQSCLPQAAFASKNECLLRFLIKAKVSKRLSSVKATPAHFHWFAKPGVSSLLDTASTPLTVYLTIRS